SCQATSLSTYGFTRGLRLGLAGTGLKALTSGSRELGELLELSGAVAEGLRRDAHLVEQRQLQVGQRRVLRVDEVTAAGDRPRAAAEQQRGQRAVRMPIAVADARPIQHCQV